MDRKTVLLCYIFQKYTTNSTLSEPRLVKIIKEMDNEFPKWKNSSKFDNSVDWDNSDSNSDNELSKYNK